MDVLVVQETDRTGQQIAGMVVRGARIKVSVMDLDVAEVADQVL